MGLMHSPKIVTDGLVLCIDSGNLKSYKGPPIQNYLTHLTASTFNTTGIVFTPGTEIVNIPEVGTVTAKTTTGYNDYPAVSTACCPSLYSYYSQFIPVEASTLYTYAILYKVNSGYTHPNFMYRYEYTSANAYVTEGGVHSTTNRIHLGDGWYWAWGTFTTQATTAKISAFSFYYQYRTSSNPDKMSVAKVLLTKGDYTQLHPKYWVDVNTTRSNTQTLSNLTTPQTITASNLTYANTGSYSFDGSVSYIDLPISSSYNTPSITFDVWCNLQNRNNRHILMVNWQGNSLEVNSAGAAQMFNFSSSGQIGAQSSNGSVPWNSWCNVVGTYDDSTNTLSVYINGNLNGTASAPSTIYNVGLHKISGNEYGGQILGSVAIAKHYNRALTAQEVKQNFNALRWRFGI